MARIASRLPCAMRTAAISCAARRSVAITRARFGPCSMPHSVNMACLFGCAPTMVHRSRRPVRVGCRAWRSRWSRQACSQSALRLASRLERFHLTLLGDTATPPARSLHEQLDRFHDFQRVYNEERPHAALGNDTPAEHYALSPRRWDGILREPEYPAGHKVKQVEGPLESPTHTPFRRTCESRVLCKPQHRRSEAIDLAAGPGGAAPLALDSPFQLDGGIKIHFGPGVYQPEDYWTVAARSHL